MTTHRATSPGTGRGSSLTSWGITGGRVRRGEQRLLHAPATRALISLSALSQTLKGSETTLLERIEAQDPPAADFHALLEEASAEHKALFESDEAFDGFEDYAVDDPATTDLLSDSEVAALVNLDGGMGGNLSREQAASDVDLYFRALEGAYGAYYYFATRPSTRPGPRSWAGWRGGRPCARTSSR